MGPQGPLFPRCSGIKIPEFLPSQKVLYLAFPKAQFLSKLQLFT